MALCPLHYSFLFQAKSEAINILSDVLTPETDSSEILSSSINFDSSHSNVLEQNVRVAIDVNRHKEVKFSKYASTFFGSDFKHRLKTFVISDNGKSCFGYSHIANEAFPIESHLSV